VVESLVLIEAKGTPEESLRSLSLGNAKQLVVGSVPGHGEIILHVAANSPTDLGNALLKFAKVSGVTGVLTLTMRIRQ
jgi:hypothetical protein